MATARYEQSVHLAETYLGERGFTLAHVRPFRLGVIADPLPGHEYLAGRLCLPYITRGGIVEIKARCIERHDCKAESCPKYLYLAGGEHRLYGVEAFFIDSPHIAVTEGEIDAIAVQALTGLPAVGYPGTSSWPDFAGRCFGGHEQVFVIADGDKPGRDAAKATAKEIGRHAQQVTVVRLEDGHDSNSYIHTYGAERFIAALGLDNGVQ